MEIEADQKTVHQLLEDLGIIQSNIVKTPRVKLSAIEAEAIENSPILEGKQATLLRIGTMRCAYLAVDRVDVSEAIKCLCTSDVETKAGHMTQLKRVCKSQAERTWKCTWTAIGLERQQRVGARLE